jgi:GT2 family glycosyltransferase
MTALVPPALAPAHDAGASGARGVSIVVPAWADRPRLRRALWSVRTTADLPYELVAACAEQSVARNRNAGLDRARCDLVAFIDDDVLLPPGWLSGLAAVIAEHADVGAASAMLSFPDGCPQSRRPDLAPGELWDVVIPGTCFLYSRGRVEDQRFDEGYEGSQWEDTDWMWRVRRRGLRTVAVGGIDVAHDHVGVQAAFLERNMRRFHGTWGRLPEGEEIYAIRPEDYRAWRPPPLP